MKIAETLYIALRPSSFRVNYANGYDRARNVVVKLLFLRFFALLKIARKHCSRRKLEKQRLLFKENRLLYGQLPDRVTTRISLRSEFEILSESRNYNLSYCNITLFVSLLKTREEALKVSEVDF